jgi:hypothetical protein
MFMESGSAQGAKFAIVREGQRDSAGSVASMVELELRLVRDRRQEWWGLGVECTAFVRAGVEASKRD